MTKSKTTTKRRVAKSTGGKSKSRVNELKKGLDSNGELAEDTKQAIINAKMFAENGYHRELWFLSQHG